MSKKPSVIVTLCIFFLLAVWPAYAQGEPLDSGIGIDHPPFQREYTGDGLSYLNVGLTLPLEEYEGMTVTGTLVGNGKTVKATGKVNQYGQVVLSFSLYSYGNYKVTVSNNTGQFIFEQAVTVGAQEKAMEPLAKAPPVKPAETQPKPEPEPQPQPKSEPATVPQPETQTQPEPKNQSTPEPEPQEQPKAEPEPEQKPAPAATTQPEGDMTWWLLIGGGIGLGVVGLLLMRRRKCEKEWEAWLAAERQLLEARTAADAAREYAQETANKRAALEAELAEIRKTFPSAGKPGGGQAWVESDGRRLTSRDVAMRREAEQAAWEQYRGNPNPETAAELEEAWNKAGEPESEEERRDLDNRARELEEQLQAARAAERDAAHRAAEAGKAAEKATAQADAAHKAYWKCMNEAEQADSAGNSGGGTNSGGAATPPGQGDTPKTRECQCREGDPPQVRNTTDLGMVTYPVRIEAHISGGDAHAAVNEGKEISDQLADTAEVLGWISKALDIKEIGETLIRERSVWETAGASLYPGAGAVLDTPTPSSPAQAALDYLSTVANIASVIIAKVPELQARRLPDCDVTITIVTRTLRATCSELWVCRGGQWVQDGKRFTLTVVAENRIVARREEALTWDQAKALIVRWDDVQMARMQNAITELARLEARCK